MKIGSGPATVRDLARAKTLQMPLDFDLGRRSGSIPSQETCPKRRRIRDGFRHCLWKRAGMVKSGLSIFALIPALALGQTDLVQAPIEVIGATDTLGVVASPTPPTPSLREATLDGREVVGKSRQEGDRVHRIGREELERAGTLGQALAREPGVMVRQSGGLGSWTQMEVRGAPASQTEVYLDGVPVGGSSGSSVDLGPIPVDGLDWIELRQAGDAGSSGAPRLDLHSRTGWTRIGGSVRQGSFGEQGVSAFGGDPSGMFTVSGWGERAKNDYPFFWNNGTIYNTRDDRVIQLENNDYRAIGVAAGVRPTESVQILGRWESTQKGVTSPSNPDPNARYGKDAVQASASWERDDGFRQHAEMAGKWVSSIWKDPSQSADYAVVQGMDEYGRDFRMAAGLEKTDAAWLMPGMDVSGRYESSERATTGGVFTTPDGNRLSVDGVFLLKAGPVQGDYGAEFRVGAGWKMDRRNFVAGISAQNNATVTQLTWWPTSDQARLWFAPTRAWTTWVSGEVSERIPDFSEWMGDNGFIMANPSLLSERTMGTEAVVQFKHGALLAKMSLWARQYERPIAMISHGAGPLGIYQNGPDSRFFGVDGDVSYCLPFVWTRMTGTIQDAKQTNPKQAIDGKWPRWTPATKGFFEVGATPWKGLSAGYTADARGEVFANEFNDSASRRSGQILQGMWISGSWRSLRMTLSVANLTDESTKDWEFLPLAGRRFQARLDWNSNTNDPRTGESSR